MCKKEKVMLYILMLRPCYIMTCAKQLPHEKNVCTCYVVTSIYNKDSLRIKSAQIGNQAEV